MRNCIEKLLGVLALAVLGGSLGGSTALAAPGDIFNLGTLNSDDTNVTPSAINDNNVIVGYWGHAGRYAAV